MSLKLRKLVSHYIPTGSAGLNLDHKILILAHGRGGKWKLMEWLSKRLKLAKFDFLCVQAPLPEVVPEMPEAGFSWFLGAKKNGLKASRDIIKQSIEEILGYGYRARDLYWLGFSQGGAMGLDYALRGDQKIGGVIGVSCFCLDVGDYPRAFGKYAKEQRIVLTHGPRDEIVPFQKAVDSYKKIGDLGIPFQFREYNKPHSFDLKNEIPDLEHKLNIWAQQKS